MRVLVPMEDGATVEYDNSEPIHPIGNGRGVPERFSYLHPGGPSQPSFRFEFSVMNGIPVCVGVHIEAKDEIPVRTGDLKLAHIDKLIISAVGAVAFEEVPSKVSGHREWRKPHGNQSFNAASMSAGKAAVKGKPRMRRNPADIDLQLVADTWRNAPSGARTESLMTVFFCSKATAARLKKRAVDAGFLP